MGKFLEGLGDELSLYVRHLAWLNAVPEDSSKKEDKPKPVTRREALRRDMKMAETDELEMPPCDAQHIVGYLFEIGPVMHSGGGPSPLTHSEIEAFQRNSGIEFDAFTARMLRRLSSEYLGALQQAADPYDPAPWEDAPYAKSRSQLNAERMKRETRALADL